MLTKEEMNEIKKDVIKELSKKYLLIEKSNDADTEYILKNIFEFICTHLKVDPIKTRGSSSKREYCTPRYIYFYIANHHFLRHATVTMIGNTIGRKHSIVSHGIKTIANLIETDRNVRAQVNLVTELLFKAFGDTVITYTQPLKIAQ